MTELDKDGLEAAYIDDVLSANGTPSAQVPKIPASEDDCWLLASAAENLRGGGRVEQSRVDAAWRIAAGLDGMRKRILSALDLSASLTKGKGDKMTKPDDITHEAWDAAWKDVRTSGLVDYEVFDKGGFGVATVLTIARAIMKAQEDERQRCAKIAEEYSNPIPMSDASDTMEGVKRAVWGAMNAVKEAMATGIAEKIRKGGDSE